MICKKHNEMLRVQTSPAARARQRDHIGDFVNVTKYCEPHFSCAKFYRQEAFGFAETSHLFTNVLRKGVIVGVQRFLAW